MYILQGGGCYGEEMRHKKESLSNLPLRGMVARKDCVYIPTYVLFRRFPLVSEGGIVYTRAGSRREAGLMRRCRYLRRTRKRGVSAP